MIYLDNAATGGRKPERVIRAVENALRHHSANPGRSGHKASLEAGNILYSCRKKAADFFGAESADQVCFTSGCTASLNMAMKGLLKKGDHLVISSLEHNAVVRPAHALERMGIGLGIAQAVPGDTAATVRAFEEAIRPETKAMVCTHSSNVTGEIMPIYHLGRLCRKRNIILIVDAAQTAGVIPINMAEMGIHILCAAPHKGLLSPMGLGLLISRVPIPFTLLEGGTGSLSLSPDMPDPLPDRMESGTLNLPAVAGLSAALDHLGTAGTESFYRKELKLIDAAYVGLAKNPKIELYTPRPEEGRCTPVLSFNIKGVPSANTAAALDERGIAVRGGLHCAPFAHKSIGTLNSGTVRISTSFFNTQNDIAHLLAAINDITKRA